MICIGQILYQKKEARFGEKSQDQDLKEGLKQQTILTCQINPIKINKQTTLVTSQLNNTQRINEFCYLSIYLSIYQVKFIV